MTDGFSGIESVHYETTDPGRDWVKDPFIAVDLDSPTDPMKSCTPNVIRLPDGGYRMYYTEFGPGRSIAESDCYIKSAISEDCVSWHKEGLRLYMHPPHATKSVLCPDVIPLPDGRYRMYYEGRRHKGKGPNVVLSALSEDGLTWEPEPSIRFGDDELSYGAPRCLYNEIGDTQLYRMYFHQQTYPMRSEPDAPNVIISAISDDGLHFEREVGVRIAKETERESSNVYAPDVIRLGDGSFRMYYAGVSVEISGGVFTAVSQDGLLWSKDPEVCVDLAGPLENGLLSEPCVIGLGDGRCRMFYEACDQDGNFRVLSATSR